MGNLYGVTVDIEGTSVLDYFDLNEIVDDSNPYTAMLGIDWAIDMNGVMNLNKWNM